MNTNGARAHKWPGGWIGQYRLPWQGDWHEVKAKPDSPATVFLTREAAELAAWRTKHRIEDPVMTRSGDIKAGARATAEAIFKKGRKIEVERKRIS